MVQHQTGSAATNQSGDLHRLVFVFVEAMHFFSSFLHWRDWTGVLLLPVLSSTKAASMTRRPQWFCHSYIEREPQCNQSHSDERRDNVTMCRNNRSQCGCVWKTMQKKKNKNMLQHVGSGLVQSADSRLCTHIKWTPRHTFTKRAGRGREHVYYYLEKG